MNNGSFSGAQDDKAEFVSRGGIKLQAALDQFNLDLKGQTVLDVGSSTGGFVDCLLQNGASKVYSVDTSYGELAWKLRKDPRVIVMERTNILHINTLPVIPDPVGDPKNIDSRLRGNDNMKVDLITIDAGWTKLELVLPVIKKFLKPQGQIIALLKPHYETDPKNLQKGVVPKELVEKIKNQVLTKIENLKFQIENCIASPILGGGGNQEFLLRVTQTD